MAPASVATAVVLFPLLKKQNERAAAPILVAGYLAILFGAIGQHDPVAGLFALPVAAFEFSLGVWLVAKGFDHAAATTLDATP